MNNKKIVAMFQILHEENKALIKLLYAMNYPTDIAKRYSKQVCDVWEEAIKEFVGDLDAENSD